MLKSIKRLACALLIAVFIVGSVSATSAEAALVKTRKPALRAVEHHRFFICNGRLEERPRRCCWYQVKCVLD